MKLCIRKSNHFGDNSVLIIVRGPERYVCGELKKKFSKKVFNL